MSLWRKITRRQNEGVVRVDEKPTYLTVSLLTRVSLMMVGLQAKLLLLRKWHNNHAKKATQRNAYGIEH